VFQGGRESADRWIEEERDRILEDSELIAALVVFRLQLRSEITTNEKHSDKLPKLDRQNP
jgi:cell division septum initiation protein DivIVA